MSDSEAPTRFNLIPFDDVLVDGKGNYLVKELIPSDGLTVIWGPPKCGKSFWVHDIAMHIALGWEYRGRRVERGPVVYVAAEGGRGLRMRIEAWRRARLESYENFIPFWLLPTALNLIEEWPELVTAIRAEVSVVTPKAIVLDTLNRTLGGSENSDEDMAAYVGACDAIRECFPGCAVIVVHHCGHEGTRPRGHTSLMGALDCQIAVKRLGDDTIVTEVERMKDGAEGAKTASRLKVVEVGTDDDGDPITSCVIEPADAGWEADCDRKVTGQARIALDALCEALEKGGDPAPASAHIPPAKTVVRLDSWRGYVKARSITETDNADTQGRAFRRAAETLQERGFIGVWQGYVWLAGTRT